jgi:hypothetical protein
MAKIYLIIFVSISCLFSAVLPLQVSVASSNTGSRQSNVNIGINLGNQAPEIAMTAVDGRILKL